MTRRRVSAAAPAPLADAVVLPDRRLDHPEASIATTAIELPMVMHMSLKTGSSDINFGSASKTWWCHKPDSIVARRLFDQALSLPFTRRRDGTAQRRAASDRFL